MASNDDAISNKGLFGTGSWMRKKRYEEEYFSLSPPSDDSGFFPYRFGVSKTAYKPPESMFDRINKEIGLTAENPKKEVTVGISEKPPGNITSSIFLGPQKIFSVDSHTLADGTPKILIPRTILEKRESLLNNELKTELSLDILKQRPEFSKVAFEDAESLIRKARPGRPTRKISMNLASSIDRNALITNFQDLSVDKKKATKESEEHLDPEKEDSETARKRRSPSPEANVTSPFISSLSVPTAIKERRRKTSAPPNMNPMDKSNNFFFTGGLFSSVEPSIQSNTSTLQYSEQPKSLEVANISHMGGTISSKSTPGSPIHQGMNTTAPLQDSTQKMQHIQEDSDLQAKPKMGKRRPRPSALREMNCWAPTSS